MYPETVKEFVYDSYQLISAGSPTVPLYGNDNLMGIKFLNQLLRAFSGTGLLTTIAQKVSFILPIGPTNAPQFVTFADPTFLPAPDVPSGRLSNCHDVWLELDGVTYPIIIENRDVFFSSYKYEPQQGLPRFAIIDNQVDVTQMQIYPSASQPYNLFVYGKFQLPTLNKNSTMSIIPGYQYEFLKLALGKQLSRYKGRVAAWTPELEQDLKDAKEEMQSVSPINLTIDSPHESYLNGSWRVRAGV